MEQFIQAVDNLAAVCPVFRFAPDIIEIQLQWAWETLFTLAFPLSHLRKGKALEVIVDTHKFYSRHRHLHLTSQEMAGKAIQPPTELLCTSHSNTNEAGTVQYQPRNSRLEEMINEIYQSFDWCYIPLANAMR